MLSTHLARRPPSLPAGETANGDFPDVAVSTMAAIVANAEVGVDYYSQYSFIRYWTTRGGTRAIPSAELVLASAASMAVGYHEDTTPEILRPKMAKGHLETLIVCLTKDGSAANLVAKYRPPCPVVVLSTEEQVRGKAWGPASECRAAPAAAPAVSSIAPPRCVASRRHAQVLRQSNLVFGHIPLKVDKLSMGAQAAADLGGKHVAEMLHVAPEGANVVVVHGKAGAEADGDPVRVRCALTMETAAVVRLLHAGALQQLVPARHSLLRC